MIAKLKVAVDEEQDEVVITVEDYEMRLELEEIETLIRVLKLGASRLRGKKFNAKALR